MRTLQHKRKELIKRADETFPMLAAQDNTEIRFPFNGIMLFSINSFHNQSTPPHPASFYYNSLLVFGGTRGLNSTTAEYHDIPLRRGSKGDADDPAQTPAELPTAALQHKTWAH